MAEIGTIASMDQIRSRLNSYLPGGKFAASEQQKQKIQN